MRSGGIAPPFLTSALEGGEWSDSRPCRFNAGKSAPGTHWIGGWVGPRAGLDAMEKINILRLPGIEPGPSSPYPVAIPTELSRVDKKMFEINQKGIRKVRRLR
jgi:hypothetical protein